MIDKWPAKLHNKTLAFEDEYKKSFLYAVRPIINFLQLFGLFPLSGMGSRDPEKIKSNWLSLRALMSAYFVIGSILAFILFTYRLVEAGPLTPSNIAGIIFYGNCLLTCVLFFNFSMNFSEILCRWTAVEKSLRKSNITESLSSNSWSLKKRVSVLASVGMLMAIFEHLMSLAAHTERLVYKLEVCNWTGKSFVEYSISQHLRFVFSGYEYNHVFGFLAEHLNFTLTFYWSFLDIFIVVISIGISFQFQKINFRIKVFKGQVVPDSIWSDIRIHYNQILDLLKFVNKALDKMIMLACFNDAYFIMVQLLNLTSIQNFIIDRAYFYYSLSFLICRMGALFLTTSSIYDNSRKPLRITRSIPKWHQEVERLNDQIVIGANAMSGMNFFRFTKQTFFGLAATIVTIETFVIQHSTAKAEREALVNCTLQE